MTGPRELSPAQLRRLQRRRAAASGDDLAADRSQLLAEQRRARPVEQLEHALAGRVIPPRRDRAAITFLERPVALGPGCRIVGYDRELLAPARLAELLEAGASTVREATL